MKPILRDGQSGVDDAFVELPRRVYAGDPLWIPEDEDAVRQAFSRRHSWFACGRAITMCVPGRARLAVFRDPRCRVGGRETAFFGYWEQLKEPNAGDELFAAAEAWAREQGAEVLCGPVNFTTFGNYRLRTEAEPGGWPFLGEPYNPTWYPGALQRLGFAPIQEYVTQIGGERPEIFTAQQTARDEMMEREGYRVETLDGPRWLALLPELHRATDEIFGDNFAYLPVPYESFAASYGESVARRLCPHSSLVAFDRDGALAGFLLAYPHYGPLVAQGGARIPLRDLSFEEHAPLLAREGHRTGVVKTVGVATAHRRRGLMSGLLVTAVERGRGRYDRWFGALVRSDNYSRRFGLAQVDAERRYALYGKNLDEGAA
jgi:ribosomal protein S18 acetylase RimI-like enzyme